MTQVPWQLCTAVEWREQAVKHAYSVTLGKMLQNAPAAVDDVEVCYLKAQHVQWDGVNLADLPTMWASPEEVDLLRVREGDLLVCEGGEVGRAAIIDREPEAPTIIQNALHLVRGRDGSDVRFLLYALRQAVDSNWIAAICNASTISHFTVDKFREMRVWVPDAKRQAAVADYLDRETRKIDTLVAAKRRLLALLSEKRRAVTVKSVEINGRCLPVRLKYAVALRGERVLNRAERPYIGLADIGPYTGDLSIDRSGLGENQDGAIGTAFEIGDVLFCKLRPYLAKVWIADFAGQCTTEALVLSPKSIEPRFLKYNLLSPAFIDRVTASTFGSKMPRAEWSSIGNMTICIPDWATQRAVADFLDSELTSLRVVESHVEKALKLLAERRFALVSGIVSGEVAVGDKGGVG